MGSASRPSYQGACKRVGLVHQVIAWRNSMSLRSSSRFRLGSSSRPQILDVLGLGTALSLGLIVRLSLVLSTDFPLNDGGLFYAMVRDLQQAGYALPYYTSYNSAGIPFAYPPLAFYLAGVVADTTGLSLLEIFRFLPTVVNTLTIVSFYLLSRTMLASRRTAIIATCAFALLPRSYEWLIMGGGLTRSVGFLLAILAIQQTHLMYKHGAYQHLWLGMLLGGCTILSHLEMACFVVYSTVVFFLFYSRNRRGLTNSLLLALGIAIVSAPWWLTIITRHGVSPLTSASDQGWPLITGVVSILFLMITNESYFPVLGFLALLGGLTCLADRKLLPLIWLVPMFALDPRGAPTLATVPLALMAGIGASRVLIPLLDLGHNTSPYSAKLDEYTPAPRASVNHFSIAGRIDIRLADLVLAFIALYAINSALVNEPSLLNSLSKDQRQAMEWIASNTPENSRFLVLTEESWAVDKASEWFPVLANRVSVATVQGQEWTGALRQRMAEHAWVQTCAGAGSECLEHWSSSTGLSFSHIYLAKKSNGDDDPSQSLRCFLLNDPNYHVIYDGPGATIVRGINRY